MSSESAPSAGAPQEVANSPADNADDAGKPNKKVVKKPRKTSPTAGSAGAEIQAATAGRLFELERLLAHHELNINNKALLTRIERLERDVRTYREAREASDFIATDLRSALDRSAASLEALKASPSYRLGALLVEATASWRAVLRLPRSIILWKRDNRRYREELEGQLIQSGTAIEYTAAVERALELAEKRGHLEAERWALDQRLRAPVIARVLSELGNLVRKHDPAEAVRLAEAALDADPNESRIKRLAFLMSDAGAVTQASQLLRSAIEHGATFSATEQARSRELFALSELASAGPNLIAKRKWTPAAVGATSRVLIFASQAYPFHWSSVSMRTHSLAMDLMEAGITVDVVTPPGYPDVGRERVDRPPSREIDGVVYHILPHANTSPGLDESYVKQTSAMLLATLRALNAFVLISPAELALSYPAAVAANLAGASLVLDCGSVMPESTTCQTERGTIISKAEDQILGHAQAALARTPAIAARLEGVLGRRKVHLIYDGGKRGELAEARGPKPERTSFVFGYIGDNAPEVDIEGMAGLLETLVRKGLDARLTIYSVGARIQAFRDQVDLAGLGARLSIEKSPPNRRAALAYAELDVVVVPLRSHGELGFKSPFQIAAALRHGKCVLAIGARDHAAEFGPALLHAEDLASAAELLSDLALNPDLRRRQEAQAQLWDQEHRSEPALLDAMKAL